MGNGKKDQPNKRIAIAAARTAFFDANMGGLRPVTAAEKATNPHATYAFTAYFGYLVYMNDYGVIKGVVTIR